MKTYDDIKEMCREILAVVGSQGDWAADLRLAAYNEELASRNLVVRRTGQTFVLTHKDSRKVLDQWTDGQVPMSGFRG